MPIGLGLAVSAATGDGAGAVGWTAEPLLVPLTIRATTTASTRIAATMTMVRRTQYVWGGSGPTGCSTLLMVRA